jgi:hypothetical protein
MTDQPSRSDHCGAWNALFKVLEGVRYRGPAPRPSPEEEERMVEEMVRRERETRREAADGLRQIVARPKWLAPGPEPSEDETMEMVVDGLKRMRREDREGS